MEKIARGRGQETNTARGETECRIRFETMPECYFFHIARAVAVL